MVHEQRPASEPSIPRSLNHYLSRDRLLSALDAASTSRLVIARAPGGAGKTTLLVDWLSRQTDERPVVWVALDESTRSRAGFWRRVVGALTSRGVLPHDGVAGEILSGFIDLDQIPALLLTELNAAPQAIRLVLDDFHLVDSTTEHEVAWMLERSSRLQLLVTSRRRLQLESSRFAVRLEPVVLTGEQLAFTLEETAAIIADIQPSLSAGDAATIHRATSGHPLATRVAIATFADGENSPVDHSSIVKRMAGEAAEDMLPAFSDPEQRRVALHLSLTPVADSILAVSLSGRDDVNEVLREFERDGFGEFARTGDGTVFTFHALVGTALLWEAERSLDADTVMELRRTAAQHLAVTGAPLDALRLFARIGDTRAMGVVIAQNFSEIINYYDAEIREIIESVAPDAMQRDGGMLAIILAIAISEREPLPSTELLDLVDSALEQLERGRSTTDPIELFFTLLWIFAGLRATRRYVQAGRAGEELLAYADSLPPAQREAIAPAMAAATMQVLITKMLLGRFDMALELSHHLINDSNPIRQQHRFSLLAYIQSMRGEMNEARRLNDSVSGARVARWRTTVPAIGWHVAESFSRLEHNDPAGALEVISLLDSRVAVVEQWPYLLWVKGLIRLAAGEPELGVDELSAAVRRNRPRVAGPFALDQLGALQSDLYLAAGSPERAAKALDARPAHAIPVVLARTRLHWATGETGGIRTALEPLLWGEAATPRQQSEAFLLQAVTELRLGFADEATLSARRAFRILDEHGLRVPLIFAARNDLRTLAAGLSTERLAMVDSMPDPFGEALIPVELTQRERRVLGELASSANLETIAQRQFIARNTVKSHLKAIYRKLGVASRAEAVAAGRRRGLLDSAS